MAYGPEKNRRLRIFELSDNLAEALIALDDEHDNSWETREHCGELGRAE